MLLVAGFVLAAGLGWVVLVIRRHWKTATRKQGGRVVWDVSEGGSGPKVVGGAFRPGRASVWVRVAAAFASIPMVLAGGSALGSSMQPYAKGQDPTRLSDGQNFQLAQDTSTTTVHTCTHGDTTANHTDIHHDQDVGGQHYDTHADGAPHNDHC